MFDALLLSTFSDTSDISHLGGRTTYRPLCHLSVFAIHGELRDFYAKLDNIERKEENNEGVIFYQGEKLLYQQMSRVMRKQCGIRTGPIQTELSGPHGRVVKSAVS